MSFFYPIIFTIIFVISLTIISTACRQSLIKPPPTSKPETQSNVLPTNEDFPSFTQTEDPYTTLTPSSQPTIAYKSLNDFVAQFHINGTRYIVPIEDTKPSELIRGVFAEAGHQLSDTEVAEFTYEWLDEVGIEDTEYRVGYLYPMWSFGKDGERQETPDNPPEVYIDDVVKDEFTNSVKVPIRFWDDLYDHGVGNEPDYHVEVYLNGHQVDQKNITFDQEIMNVDALIQSLGLEFDDFYEGEDFNVNKFQSTLLSQIPFLLSYDGLDIPIWGLGGTYNLDVVVTDYNKDPYERQ